MVFKDQYFFLSTFYPCNMTLNIEGKECTFLNVEAAYHAQKNPKLADKWSKVKGLEAKRMGEKFEITVPNWDDIHLYAMANALHAKFSNSYMLSLLKKLPGEIIQDNYWGDTYWGVYKGQGQNILGRMLTNIRDNNNDYKKLCDFIKNEILKKDE